MKNKTSTHRSNVFQVLKPYKGIVALLIFFALLSNAINLVIPKIISHAIDDFSHGHFSMRDVLLIFSVSTLFIFIFAFLQGILQTYASERVARDIRMQLSEKISRQNYAFIQQSNPSRLLTNLTSDVDSIKMFVSMALVSLVSSVFIIIATSILLLSINWKLALNVLVIIPVIVGAFGFVFTRLRVLFKQSREMVDRLNRIINENIVAAALVRIVNAQIPEFNKFTQVNAQARDISLSILKLFATLIPIVVFVSNMAALAILFLGGHFVIIGSMTLGDFAAFNSYLTILIFPIIVVGFISNFIAQASTAYGRVMEVINAPDTEDTGDILAAISGNVLVDNISVTLDEKPVLKNISFALKATSKTAIIGPTGAGKTQLLYVLCGLLKQQSGNVFLDDTDLNDINKECLQNQIAIVFQDSVMFNLTLRENIAFNDQVDPVLLDKAIRAAELSDFIASLPAGLDTVISERGNSLSGGQKQRIMLARALALDPRILMLDDFTARVDNVTEAKIINNLKTMYPALTLISVTQKISSVQDYDQIILLEDGELLAKGTHSELLSTCTEYIQIYHSQRSTNNYEQNTNL